MSGGLTLRIVKPGATVNVLETVVKTVQIYDFRVGSDVIPETIGTDKGDMIAYAADEDPRRLAVGSDGQVLTAASGETLGVKWAAPASAGYNDLKNNTAGNLGVGAVVVWDTSADNSVKTSTTEGDRSVAGVLAEAIDAAETGRVATGGTVEAAVLVTGNVTRGNWLIQSTSAGRAKDSGTTAWYPGCFAIAMDGYAGGGSGTVKAFIIPNPSNAKPVSAQFWLSAAGITPRTTGGCAYPAAVEMSTNKNNHKVAAFDQTTQEFGQWVHALPSDYGGGTVTAIFYWTANSTSTNSAVWGLQAVTMADDDALDVAFGTAQEVADANKSTAYDLNVSAATSAITIAGTPAAGELINWQIYRDVADGSDDLAVDALLIGVMITYTRL